MAAFIIRPKLTLAEAAKLKTDMENFFKTYPRKRICRVGDSYGVWMIVRKKFIDLDVDAHTGNAQ